MTLTPPEGGYQETTMATTTQTQAQRWTMSPDGGRGDGYETWTDALAANAEASWARHSRSDHGSLYTWPDGSAILVVDGSWDVVQDCGRCWVGGGRHSTECEAETAEE